MNLNWTPSLDWGLHPAGSTIYLLVPTVTLWKSGSIENRLVVSTVLKNMSSSMGRMTSNIMEKKIHVWNQQSNDISMMIYSSHFMASLLMNSEYYFILSASWFKPYWKILVSWDDEIPNIWNNKKCSKPPTSYVILHGIEAALLPDRPMVTVLLTVISACSMFKYPDSHSQIPIK